MEGLFTIIGLLLITGCIFVIVKIFIIGAKTLISSSADQKDLDDNKEMISAQEKREILSTIIRHLFI